MADYVVNAVVPVRTVVVDIPTAERLEALMFAASQARCTDAETHQAAEAIHAQLKAAEKELEATRVAVKAPALAVCRQIDEIAKPFTTGLLEQRRALEQRIAAYTTAENARIAETNRLAREAALAEERRLEAARTADLCPFDDAEMLKPIRVAPVEILAPIATGVSVRTVPKLQIDDASLIPRKIRVGDVDIVLLVPDEKVITALLKAKVPVAGCRMVDVVSTASKAARG